MACWRWSRASNDTGYERGYGRHKTNSTMISLSDRQEKQRHGHAAKTFPGIYGEGRWRLPGKLGVIDKSCEWQDP